MTGAFVGATVVALMQYLRLRDRRLLLLAVMFLLQAVSLGVEWWSVWRDVSQGGVCLAGLALLLALSPRHPPGAPAPPSPLPESTPTQPPPADPA